MSLDSRSPAAYLWASPNTLLGLLIGFAGVCAGAHLRVVDGVVEIHGGHVARWFARLSLPMRFVAMTLGHVILAVSSHDLDAVRRHEYVHVRQYERWGPLFLPLYVLCGMWELLHGRRAYRDNYFEREAFAADTDIKA